MRAPAETPERSAAKPLAERIHAVRTARGLGLREAARPYSSAYLSLLEAGLISPSARALDTIGGRLSIETARGSPPEDPIRSVEPVLDEAAAASPGAGGPPRRLLPVRPDPPHRRTPG